jgi:uncharacterized protein (TIGR02145 family)
MKNIYILILLLPLNSIFCQLFTQGPGVNDIEGNSYNTIIINGQEWMAENLKTTKYANGESIQFLAVIGSSINGNWGNPSNGGSNPSEGGYNYYNQLDSYTQIYGNLYNGYAVLDPRGLCPSGWHVPTLEERNQLIDFLGGEYIAGGKMKKVTNLWNYPNTPNLGATNESGFSGLPGGKIECTGPSSSPQYKNINFEANFWTSSIYENGTNSMWMYRLHINSTQSDQYTANKRNGFSVRCINNNFVGINEIKLNSKKLLKITDLMGKETSVKPNEIQFYLFDDGSVEKRLICE